MFGNSFQILLLMPACVSASKYGPVLDSGVEQPTRPRPKARTCIPNKRLCFPFLARPQSLNVLSIYFFLGDMLVNISTIIRNRCIFLSSGFVSDSFRNPSLLSVPCLAASKHSLRADHCYTSSIYFLDICFAIASFLLDCPAR